MGIRDGIFVFLRAPYRGGKDRPGRPGSKEKEIEFEREREREIPQAKNPSGLSDRGALSRRKFRPVERQAHVYVRSSGCGIEQGLYK